MKIQLPLVLAAAILSASCATRERVSSTVSGEIQTGVKTTRETASPSVVTNSALMALRSGFTNSQVQVAGTNYQIVIRWEEQARFMNCQRPQDLCLVSNRVGAFVNFTRPFPADDFTKLKDASCSLKVEIAAFLKTKGIQETKIKCGWEDPITEQYEQNKAPEGTVRKFVDPQH